MIDIEEFSEILTEICNELPDEFFKDLHHGVQLSEDLKISPYAKGDDLIIMGEYHRSKLGNMIMIYYGSFVRTCSWMSREQLTDKIREVVRHEFRHHMENRAGMYGRDSLEYEDAEQLRSYLQE